MRKYTLASSEARTDVDLRDHRDTITEAVLEIMPNATITVVRDCYYVSPTPSRGDAIRIGRQICKSGLGQHCVQIPKLFSSVEIKENNHEKQQPQHPCGHF